MSAQINKSLILHYVWPLSLLVIAMRSFPPGKDLIIKFYQECACGDKLDIGKIYGGYHSILNTVALLSVIGLLVSFWLLRPEKKLVRVSVGLIWVYLVINTNPILR